MQSSIHCRDSSNISLGERRGKSDLARFSLDLSWARSVSDTARSRAYPSPPMSGSPPLPPRRNPDLDHRGQSGFGATSQDVPRGVQAPQTEPRENVRGVAPLRPYQQEPLIPTSYPPFQRTGDAPVDQSRYQQQPPMHYQQQQQQAPPQQMPVMPLYPLRHPHAGAFQGPAQGVPEAPGYTSPKAQRKTKGHVASACVPCKRAHLRCDAQRPCSRCLTNGKEEACIDVQHKKRGRPRLRDEREHRFEGLGQNYSQQGEHLMRRPVSLYSTSESPMTHSDALHRSSSYRVLKSQSGGPGMAAPRYLEHASNVDASLYGGQMPPNPRPSGMQEPPCAYLNMDLQISSATRSFSDAIATPSVLGRKLLEMVASNDRDKVYRLQRMFEEERQEREPNYLPPIYGRSEEDRVIQSIGLGIEEFSQLRTERQEVLAFQGPDGQLRSYQVRLVLAKKESTYYVILVLVIPATPLGMQQMPPSPYSREAGYGFQAPPQAFAQPPGAPPYGQYPTQYTDPRAREPQVTFRQPPPLRSNSGSSSVPTTPATPYYVQSQSQPFGRPSEYGQPQDPRQVPRSELPQGQGPRQNEFRLPPIQSQSATTGGGGRGDDRGRVDIGGLIEKPDSQRRPQ